MALSNSATAALETGHHSLKANDAFRIALLSIVLLRVHASLLKDHNVIA